MIVREDLGNGISRVYSDAGVKIHGGFPEADYDIVYTPTDVERTYVETDIPVDSALQGPTQYSKLKILMAAQEAGFAEALIGFIESNKTIEYIWNASNVIEDNALLAAYLPAIAQALDRDEAAVKAFLDAYCIVD